MGLASTLKPASVAAKLTCALLTTFTEVSMTVVSATMLLPGSSISRGEMPRPWQRSLNMGRTAAARSAGVGAGASGWYWMPSPPPRSILSILPPAELTSAAMSIIFPAASAKGAVSRICEPIWQCSPTGLTPSSSMALV